MSTNSRAAASSVSRTGLTEQVYLALKEDIMNDNFVPEERIVIDRLARDMNVSATPVREALARLAAEELVSVEPYVGYKVLARPTLEDLRQLFEAREAIEGFAARLAAERITEAGLAELNQINTRILSRRYGKKRYRDYADFVLGNQEFHAAVLEVAQCKPLARSFQTLHYDALISRASRGRGVPDLDEIAYEHGRILDALRDQDPDAAQQAAVDHIRTGARRMLGAYRDMLDEST